MHDDDSQGYFDPEGPGEHDHHLFDSDQADNDYIACPHCGGDVLAFSEWCPHCGQAFKSEAWREPTDAIGMGGWVGAVAVVLLIVLLLVWLL